MTYCIAFPPDFERKVRNTHVDWTHKEAVVRFYDTVIVHVLHNREAGKVQVTLNSGEWRTRSTRDRINRTMQALDLPVNVHQHRRKWLVETPTEVMDFQDHISFKVTPKVAT